MSTDDARVQGPAASAAYPIAVATARRRTRVCDQRLLVVMQRSYEHPAENRNLISEPHRRVVITNRARSRLAIHDKSRNKSIGSNCFHSTGRSCSL
jgi:hypothetical protein